MSGLLIVILLAILAVQLIFLLILASFGVTLFFGSPWVPTHRNRARRMLEFAAFVPGETIIDLGSGDGSILFCAVEDFGARQAIGYEINPLLVVWANIRSYIRKMGKRTMTYRKNIFTAPFPQVDVVATFLIPLTMKRLQEKFATELAPDTRIVSRGFAIPGVTPLRKHEGPEEWMYLYRAGDLLSPGDNNLTK